MLQKNAITEVIPDSPGFYSNILLVCKASGGWRPVIDLKRLNTHIHAPHFHMFTISSVLSTVKKATMPSKSICRMRFSRSNTSQQQEVSQVCLRKQGLSVSSTSLRSENSPSDLYSSGAYCHRLPSSSGDFSYPLPRRLVS